MKKNQEQGGAASAAEGDEAQSVYAIDPRQLTIEQAADLGESIAGRFDDDLTAIELYVLLTAIGENIVKDPRRAEGMAIRAADRAFMTTRHASDAANALLRCPDVQELAEGQYTPLLNIQKGDATT